MRKARPWLRGKQAGKQQGVSAVLRAGFYLEQSLLDMQDLCVRTDTKAAPRPKL